MGQQLRISAAGSQRPGEHTSNTLSLCVQASEWLRGAQVNLGIDSERLALPKNLETQF